MPAATNTAGCEITTATTPIAAASAVCLPVRPSRTLRPTQTSSKKAVTSPEYCFNSLE